MDTSSQPVIPKRQQRTLEEKRRIVEETLGEGASVARVPRAHGVNANQVFKWRKLYLAGRLGAAERSSSCRFA
jgi:transposase